VVGIEVGVGVEIIGRAGVGADVVDVGVIVVGVGINKVIFKVRNICWSMSCSMRYIGCQSRSLSSSRKRSQGWSWSRSWVCNKSRSWSWSVVCIHRHSKSRSE
jgi:hypothetical protein